MLDIAASTEDLHLNAHEEERQNFRVAPWEKLPRTSRRGGKFTDSRPTCI
jgi:hypothetical protein